MTIGALRPGVAPAEVLPGATAAAEAFTVVEAGAVNVVAGEARLTVRFTAETAEEADRIGRAVVDGTGAFAHIDAVRMTRRVGSRWSTLAS